MTSLAIKRVTAISVAAVAAAAGIAAPSSAQTPEPTAYTCATSIAGRPSGSIAVTVEASATAPASAAAGTTIDLADITLTIDIEGNEQSNFTDQNMVHAVLDPSGNTVTMGPASFGELGSDRIGTFAGGTDSFVLEGQPGDTVGVTLPSFNIDFVGWPLPPVTVLGECSPDDALATLTSVEVADTPTPTTQPPGDQPGPGPSPSPSPSSPPLAPPATPRPMDSDGPPVTG